MRVLRRLWVRFIGTLRGARRDDELSAEIDAHVQMQIEDKLRMGMSPQEARRAALVELGGIEAAKEAYRDQRGLPLIDVFLRDVRHAARRFWREPAFHLAVVLVLACTTALCIVIFSAAYAILLRPLPYTDPHRLVRVHETAPDGERWAATAGNFHAWQEQATVFEDLVAFNAQTFELRGARGPERVQGARVSARLLDALGVRPALGRTFLPGEDEAGRADVVLISHRFWMRYFDGDPRVVGKLVPVGASRKRVVGVLPAGFEFPAARSEFSGDAVEMLEPVDWSPEGRTDRGNRTWRVIGRLPEDMSLAEARQGMAIVAKRLAAVHESNRRWGVFVEPLRDSIFGKTETLLWLILVSVGALLLVGCTNVANLLLARGVARQREFALRAAIGGSTGRLCGQVLTESFILALAGATFGLAMAGGALRVLLALAPKDLPRIEHVSIDGTVVAATFGLAAATALLFGALPAWYAGRSRPSDALRSGGRASIGRAGARLQSGLVVGQVAMTAVLLMCAGLLLRSVIALQQVETGLDAAEALTFRVVLDEERYPDEQGGWRFLSELLQRISTLPGVKSAAAVAPHAPFVWSDSVFGFSLVGQSTLEPGQGGGALRYCISPNYFATMGVPLLAGRGFTERDDGNAPPVAIVNAYLARKHLSGLNPIGARLKVVGVPDDVEVEVVGVVGDTRHYGPDTPIQEQLYLPYAQYPSTMTTVVAKTAVAPESLVPLLRRTVAEADPEQAVSNIVTMEQAITGKIAGERLSAALLAAFAAVALLLAGVGIYAVFSYIVGQRTPEIGLRLALGAQPRDVLRQVMASVLRITAAGLTVGLVVTWPATQWLRALLFGVEPSDPLTFGVVAAILFGAALVACLRPARTAMHVNPVSALRGE